MEVVSLHVGACGLHVASDFWSAISKEHGLDLRGQYKGNSDSQLEHIECYFSGTPSGSYCPRALLIDLDSASIDAVRASEMHSLYSVDSYVYARGARATGGASDNFAQGFHSKAEGALHTVVEAIREQVEKCDSFQGFQLSHAIGGGTGAGFSARLLQHIADQYPHRMSTCFSVQPSPPSVVGPYNALLSLAHLAKNSHHSILIDNAKVNGSNQAIAKVMSGVTSTLRFSSLLNNTMRKIATNLVPFRKLNFLAVSQAPRTPDEACSISDLTHQLYEPSSCVSGVRFSEGRFLGSTAIFRGAVSALEVEESMRDMRSKRGTLYVDWLPDNCLSGVCAGPASGASRSSATLVANSTAVKSSLRQMYRSFQAMYSRGAFLHLFTECGMEQQQFESGREALREIIELYEAYEVADDVQFFSSSEENNLEESQESEDSDLSLVNQLILDLPDDGF